MLLFSISSVVFTFGAYSSFPPFLFIFIILLFFFCISLICTKCLPYNKVQVHHFSSIGKNTEDCRGEAVAKRDCTCSSTEKSAKAKPDCTSSPTPQSNVSKVIQTSKEPPDLFTHKDQPSTKMELRVWYRTQATRGLLFHQSTSNPTLHERLDRELGDKLPNDKTPVEPIIKIHQIMVWSWQRSDESLKWFCGEE